MQVTSGILSLFDAARAEARGEDVSGAVRDLLSAGHDPHACDEAGNTAFNISADNSPVTGRLMTLHWLQSALAGKGRGLNDVSGSHGSTLAQYMAKWLTDEEVEGVVSSAVQAGMKADIPNASGWTPLIAAMAMGQVGAVRIFSRFYTLSALQIRTIENYRARYIRDGVVSEVVYVAGLDAQGVAEQRLLQDKNMGTELRERLERCLEIIRLQGP